MRSSSQKAFDIFLPTLLEHVDLSNVHVRWMDKGFVEYGELPGTVEKITFKNRSIPEDVTDTLKYFADTAKADLIFMCHLDVRFRGDWISHYREVFESDPKIGQVGTHRTGLVGYRREAYKEMKIGFSDLSYMHASSPKCFSRKGP